MVLSIGFFFSLMIVGLAASLPKTMDDRLVAQGVQPEIAAQVADEPPVGSLFAAFLGYNPMETLLGDARARRACRRRRRPRSRARRSSPS